jgi:hypothetical protein
MSPAVVQGRFLVNDIKNWKDTGKNYQMQRTYGVILDYFSNKRCKQVNDIKKIKKQLEQLKNNHSLDIILI